jgi:hypothetical protein
MIHQIFEMNFAVIGFWDFGFWNKKLDGIDFEIYHNMMDSKIFF